MPHSDARVSSAKRSCFVMPSCASALAYRRAQVVLAQPGFPVNTAWKYGCFTVRLRLSAIWLMRCAASMAVSCSFASAQPVIFISWR